MNHKSIIFITENYASGGANKYAEDLIASTESSFQNIFVLGNPKAMTSFDKSRIPVRAIYQSILIFNLSELIKNFKRPTRLTLRILLLPVAILVNLFSYFKLSIFIAATSPYQVVLCNGGYPASLYLLFALLFIKKKYRPVLTIVSTPARKKSRFFNFFWSWVDSFVQRRTHLIAVNSEAIKKEMVDHYNFSPESIKIVRNGVADQSISKDINKNKITIGFVSRVEIAKGIQELLKAYELLVKDFSNIELLVVGSGSQNDLVVETAKRIPSIKFLGHISGDLSPVLKQIDIFTLPSYQEGLPYSVIEACMASCAIVGTNVGGIPEIITHGESGFLIPPRNSDALYLALKELITHNELRINFSNEARKKYEAQFTLERMKEQIQIILQ